MVHISLTEEQAQALDRSITLLQDYLTDKVSDYERRTFKNTYTQAQEARLNAQLQDTYAIQELIENEIRS